MEIALVVIAGLIGLCIVGAWFWGMLSSIRDRWWPMVLFLTIVALFVAFVFVALAVDAQSPTISIRKDQWECTKSVDVTTTTYVQSGKVLVPMTITSQECTTYVRR